MNQTEVQKRDDILRSVIDLLSSSGPDGVTIRQVAKAAGVSQGAVSYHYKTRSELFRATLDWILERIDARRRELWEAAKSPRTKLASLFICQEKLLTEEPELLTAWYSFVVLGRSDRWVAARVQEHFVDRIEMIQAFLKETLVGDKIPRDLAPGLTASDINASIEGMGLLWLNRPDVQGIAAHRRRSVRRWQKLLDLPAR